MALNLDYTLKLMVLPIKYKWNSYLKNVELT